MNMPKMFGGRRRTHKRRARTRARRSRLGRTMKSVDQLVGLPFGAVGLKRPATRVLRRRKSHKKCHTKRHRRHSRKHSRKHRRSRRR
jgi:hypothetical protein